MKTSDDDKYIRRSLMELEQYPFADLVPFLKHEVSELRERAYAELVRRSEVYETADGMVWMWQNAVRNKAYGGGTL